MANEIEADYATGQTLYAQVRSSTGLIWNTAAVALQNYNTANVADYDIALTEQGTASGYYAGNMPAVPAGMYNVVAKRRVGGAPAETDPTVAAGTIPWDGDEVVQPANLLSVLGDGTAATGLASLAAQWTSDPAYFQTVATMNANTVTASALAADAVAEIQSGLSTLTAPQVWSSATRTLTSLSGLTVDNVTTVAAVTLVNGLAANTVTSSAIADNAITDAKIAVPAEAAGRPSRVLAMLRRAWEWKVNRKTRDRTTGNKVLYGDDGTTVLETQVQSTAGTVDQETEGS